MQKSVRLLKNVFLTIFIVLAVFAIVVFSARKSFMNQTGKMLEESAFTKQLHAESAVSGQLSLVRQMVRSNAIIRYMKNPNDTNAFNEAFNEFDLYKDSFESKSIFWVNDVDKKFWSDMKVAYTVDPDAKSEYWYKMTMFETDEYNFNINYNPQLKAIMLWVNAVVRDAEKNPIGVAGTGIPLTNFVKSMYDGVKDDITMYLYTSDGKIVGAKDLSLLEKEIDVREEFPRLKELPTFIPQTPMQFSLGRWEIILHPIQLLGLHLIMARPCTIKTLIPYMPLPFVICIVVILVMFVLILFLRLVSHIAALNDGVEVLSSGHADLTARVSVDVTSRFHAFNNLIASFNKFIEKLHDIMKEVKETKDILFGDGEKLKNLVQRNSTFVAEMVDGIKHVEKELVVQDDEVVSTVNATDGISKAVEKLDDLLETQEEGVESASSAVTEMIGNINSVSKSMEKMANEFSILQNDVVLGIEEERDVNKQIQKIEEQSKMLDEANAVISSIAEQTSLLAMNAAIEAAHAGESGKGFAVVAEEIRKLSENSSSQSKNIGQQLSTILASISDVVEKSTKTNKVFADIAEKIGDTGNLVHEIKQAMEEQAEGSKQISNALGAMNSATHQVRAAADDVENSRKKIVSDVEGMQQSSEAVQISLENIRDGVKQIEEGDDSLLNIATEINDSIYRVNNQIDQFKV